MPTDAPSPVEDPALVGDLVARERRTGHTALRALVDGLDRTYSYRDLCTTSYKAGNFLRALGVRGATGPNDDRGTVAVTPDPAPEPVLTFLGAAQLGAVTRFEPRSDGDARVTVVHAADESAYDPPAGSKLAVYGDPPERPTTDHWEGQVWSENPAVQPATVDPSAPALVGAGEGARAHSHRDLLAAASAVADRLLLSPDAAVAVRASLADPRTVVAGVLAPLLVGATAVFPDETERGDVAVGGGPEPTTLALSDVPLDA
jgi:acyl-CoA synthetase (AMP-forming)/AMP-acid ligase II